MDAGNMLESDAIISDCGKYRYLLSRVWDYSKQGALVVMLNPSTADATKDDATIRSLIRLLSAIGYGSFEVVNLFALRATSPKELLLSLDPIGPENNSIISSAIARCDIPICAWGANKMAVIRHIRVEQHIRSMHPAVFCFGMTKAGYPKHPLYLKTGTRLEVIAP